MSPGVVPKTPSGKIRRAAAREAFQSGAISGPPGLAFGLRIRLLASVARDRVRSALHAAGTALRAALIVTAGTAVLVALGPLAWILLHALPAGRPVRALSRVVSRVMVAISGCSVAVEGRSRLPRSGPLVLVANHTSYADTPFILAALGIDFVIVTMSEIFSWPVVGTFVRRGRHPTVDRWHPKQSLAHAQAVEQRLREGEVLLFFPEGGFTGAAGLRPFRLGAFSAAAATGAPVIPVALRGSRRIFPEGARLPRPGRVHVWIGEPLHPEGTGWKAVVDLRNRAAEAIASHCGEPRRAGVVAAGRTPATPREPTSPTPSPSASP